LIVHLKLVDIWEIARAVLKHPAVPVAAQVVIMGVLGSGTPNGCQTLIKGLAILQLVLEYFQFGWSTFKVPVRSCEVFLQLYTQRTEKQNNNLSTMRPHKTFAPVGTQDLVLSEVELLLFPC